MWFFFNFKRPDFWLAPSNEEYTEPLFKGRQEIQGEESDEWATANGRLTFLISWTSYDRPYFFLMSVARSKPLKLESSSPMSLSNASRDEPLFTYRNQMVYQKNHRLGDGRARERERELFYLIVTSSGFFFGDSLSPFSESPGSELPLIALAMTAPERAIFPGQPRRKWPWGYPKHEAFFDGPFRLLLSSKACGKKVRWWLDTALTISWKNRVLFITREE